MPPTVYSVRDWDFKFAIYLPICTNTRTTPQFLVNSGIREERTRTINMKTTKTKSQVGEREETALRTLSTSTLALRISFVHMLDIHTITIIDFLFNTYHKIQKQ